MEIFWKLLRSDESCGIRVIYMIYFCGEMRCGGGGRCRGVMVSGRAARCDVVGGMILTKARHFAPALWSLLIHLVPMQRVVVRSCRAAYLLRDSIPPDALTDLELLLSPEVPVLGIGHGNRYFACIDGRGKG